MMVRWVIKFNEKKLF